MKTPDGKVFEEKPKGERLPAPLRAGLRAVRRALAGLLRALAGAIVAFVKGVGKVAITIWRLAAALDSALWRAIKFLGRRARAGLGYALRLIGAALNSLLLWLPTRTGRAYSAASGIALVVSLLWIADELRAGPEATREADGRERAPVDRDDPILARIEGRYVHLSEIAAAARASGALGAGDVLTPKAAFDRGLVEAYVERRLLAEAAQSEGLHRAPAVLRRVNAARDEILAATLVELRLQSAVTNDAINRYYLAQRQLSTPGEEVSARHMLLASEAEARAVLAELEAGADFGEIARERSLDPATAPLGGRIGWFSRAMMAPDFANAAFESPPGARTLLAGPSGWHVIETLDRRRRAPKPLAAVEDDIEAFLNRRVLGDLLAALAAEGEVAYYRPDAASRDEEPPPPRMPGDEAAALPAETAAQ